MQTLVTFDKQFGLLAGSIALAFANAFAQSKGSQNQLQWPNTNMLIYNADANLIMQKLPAESIDCAVLDPPYKTGKPSTKGYQQNLWAGRKGTSGLQFGKMDFDLTLGNLYRVMKKGSHGYMFINDLNLCSMRALLTKKGFGVHKNLIWVKNTFTPNWNYCGKHEYIIFFYKAPAKHINDTSFRTVFTDKTIHHSRKLQKHQKPLSLVEKLVLNSTKEGDVVLDFSMGSGTAGVAALQNDRKFIGMDIDPKHFQIAKVRLEEIVL